MDREYLGRYGRRGRASFSSTQYDTTSSGSTSVGTEDPKPRLARLRHAEATESVGMFDFGAAVTADASDTSSGSNFWSSHFFSETTRMEQNKWRKRRKRRKRYDATTMETAGDTLETTSTTTTSSVDSSYSYSNVAETTLPTESTYVPPRKKKPRKRSSSESERSPKAKKAKMKTKTKMKTKAKAKTKTKAKAKKKDAGAKSDAANDTNGTVEAAKISVSPTSKALWVSRASYANVLKGVPDSRLQYTNYELQWGEFTDYKVAYDQVVGAGAFGEVCLATHRKSKNKVVMKIIKPDKMRYEKIQQEVKMLDLVSGGPNIIHLLDLVEDPKRALKMLVFECIYSPRPSSVFSRMSDWEARNYLYQVLAGLLFTHSMGIMHRDIKTGNVLYDPKRKQVAIIDWGLAEFYRYDVPLPKYPGTKSWKAPELLLRYPRYDYGVDMWAYGCLMGQVLFGKRLFLRDKNNDTNQAQFDAIAESMGTKDLFVYMKKFRIAIRTKDIDLTRHSREKLTAKTDFGSWTNDVNSAVELEEGADLIDKILVYDHEVRWTAEEAIQHPYFDPVRSNKLEDLFAPKKRITNIHQGVRTTFTPPNEKKKHRRRRGPYGQLLEEDAVDPKTLQSMQPPTSRSHKKPNKHYR